MCEMEFSTSSFNINFLDNFFKKRHSINIRTFLIDLKDFLSSVENIARTEDPFEVPHLKLSHLICNGDVLFFLNYDSCSDKFGRIIRRKFGLNSLEIISLLYKFSVSSDKICLFVRGEML